VTWFGHLGDTLGGAVALSLSLFLSLSLSFPPRSGVQTEKTTKNKQIQVLFVFLTFLLVNLWFLFVFYIGFGTREGFPNISCQFLEPQNIFPLSISLFGLPSFSLSLSFFIFLSPHLFSTTSQQQQCAQKTNPPTNINSKQDTQNKTQGPLAENKQDTNKQRQKQPRRPHTAQTTVATQM
jgi:hypothetical protein